MPTLDDALAALGDSSEAIADTQSTPSFSMPQATPAPRRTEQAPGTLDDALDVLEQPERADQLRGSVNLGTQQDQSRSTKVLQLFGKTGLPRDFIERNQEFVQQQADQQGFDPDKLMKESPAFASWLAEHPDHVAAAKSDVGNLSYVERQLRYMGLQGESGPLQLELGDLGQKAFDGTITKQERARQAEIEARLGDIDALGKETDITGFFEQIPGQVIQQIPTNLRIASGAIKEGAKGLVEGAALGAIAGSVAGGAGAVPGAVAGGALGSSYGALTGMVIEAGKMEMHHAYLDYEKLKDDNGDPLDQTTIRGLAIMTGSINGMLEGLFGTERLGAKIPGVSAFTRKGIKELLKTPTARAALLGYAKTVGAQVGIEGATEYIQEIVTSAGGVLAKALKDGGSPTEIIGKVFSPENLDRYAEAGRAGAQAGGGMATVMTSPQLAQDIAKVRAANRFKQSVEDIGKNIENMKFAKDLPGPLRDIISRATKDGDVYMPRESFNTYFQSQSVDPRAVYQEITGDVEAYDRGIETGADLPIKAADYLSKIAGTEHNAALIDDLREDIDAMNARESEQWAKEQDAQAEAEAAAIAQPGIQRLGVDDPAAQVRIDIQGQLEAAGYAPEVARTLAIETEARYSTRAERRGLGESPADLFRSLNLTITREIPSILKTLGKQQTELDSLLNRLRKGDTVPLEQVHGQSLAEFLKAQGGVQDQGGELAARNVDQNRKAFKKKLVQKGGKTLDDAATSAFESGYIASPEIAKLLDALDQESRGTPVFAVGKENARALDLQQNLESLKQYLDQRGIDLATATNEEIKAQLGEAIQQPLPTVEGQTFAQAVYHGTPNVWEPEPGFPHGRPRLDKIGTGEGAQAYGWGIYLADSKGVAGSYKDLLSTNRIVVDGKRFITVDPKTFYGLKGIGKKLGLDESEYSDAESIVRQYVRWGNWDQVQKNVDEQSDYFRPRSQAILDKIKPRITIESNGSLYELDVPDNVVSTLLDWDKSISEQSEHVRKAIESSGVKFGTSSTGEQIYNAFASRAVSAIDPSMRDRSGSDQKAGSEELKRLGIPGLRYLDGASRNNASWKMIPASESVSGKWVVSMFGGSNSSKFDTESEAQAFLDEQLAGQTSNYVIWDQSTLDKIALLKRNEKKLDAIREGQTFAQGGQTDTPAFKKWFGDSKVVDANGEPLVVYHGTGVEIEAFDLDRTGRNIDSGWIGKGVYLTSSEQTADYYATISSARTGKKVVLHLYASIQNPFRWGKKGKGIRGLVFTGERLPDAIHDEVLRRSGFSFNPDAELSDTASMDEKHLSEVVRQVLIERGYDGVVAEVAGRQEYVAFHPEQIKSATGNAGTFDPNNPSILHQGDEGKKGSITFGNQEINIKLMEKADISTFLHESGHLYLNELVDDATTEGVPQQLRDDLDTILKWFRLDIRADAGADAIKAAIQTQHHEQFARGFEAYTMEGKAPTQALREAFASFRQWMIQVYRMLTTAPLNVQLTKPVREVMDRLIATDEAIDQAAQEAEVHPMFTDAESAGMTPARFEAYKKDIAEASMSAREDLQRKLMAQLQRQDAKWWKERRAELVKTITDEVNDQNEYVVLAVLKTGKLPDGSPLPDGIQPMKLDRKTMVKQFGDEFMKNVPSGITGKNGMHPDAAAPIFGYRTGAELVEALVNARPKQQLIEAEADQRMIEQFGDMRFDGTIAEEAKAAVLNEQREKVVQAEMRAIAAKRREVQPFVKAAQKEIADREKVGRDLLKTVIPSIKDTRELARKIMGRSALKTIKPNQYMVTARQASRSATAALSKREFLDAGKFKQQELLNLALYREAKMLEDQIDSAKELAGKFFGPDATLAKSRNVDLVNVGRAILAQYSLGATPEKTAAEYLKPILTYDKDLYDQWAQVVDALAPRKLDYKALTVDEFTQLHEDMKSLWLLSRRTQQAKIDGQLVDRQQIVDELSAVMAGFTPRQLQQVVGPQTSWEETKVGLLSWKSALRRVESWVDAMDGGAINGPFRRYVWNPISDASIVFRSNKKNLLLKYLDLIKPIESTIHKDLIVAHELNGFAFRGRAALLHAVLHTGNESNKSKLVRGYKWDMAAFDRFIERMQAEGVLTKADYDYAQGVWDLLESVKPDAQKAHHEMYGYYFNEITATPITTPWGEYRGGYVPAIADRAKSADQAIREEKELFDQGGNSFMFPTTGRGFTKSRIEAFAAPLALDLTTIPVHIDKTMRFIHLEPRIKDAARLVTNKELRASLDAMNSTVAKDMLVPWLQRSAQQTVSTPGRNRYADKIFRALRANSGAQIMVGNVLNTLQQFTGASIALTKVKARYMRGSLVNYLRHPIQYADDIAARSDFMKDRTVTQVIEVQSALDNILLNPSKYEKARKFAQQHGYFMQQGTQNVVDLLTWGAAYDQATAEGLDEKMAVRSADSAVRLTQGSFAPEDISNFEAGTPFARAFTMFYSYFNMQANLLGTEFSKVAQDMGIRKGAGRAFYIYVFGFMIPAVMAELIVKGIGGFDPDDDDDYLNEALSLFFGSQLRTALALFPGVGPATLAGINMFNDKWYDDRISTSPVVSLLESAVRAPHSLYKAMSDDGHSKRAVKDVLTLIGLVAGVPAGALARPLGYLADVADDKANPEDPIDVARGLISGRDVNRTK